jgi:hypothetical protein
MTSAHIYSSYYQFEGKHTCPYDDSTIRRLIKGMHVILPSKEVIRSTIMANKYHEAVALASDRKVLSSVNVPKFRDPNRVSDEMIEARIKMYLNYYVTKIQYLVSVKLGRVLRKEDEEVPIHVVETEEETKKVYKSDLSLDGLIG